MKKFPGVIYCVSESDGKEEYLVTNKSIEDIPEDNDGEKVAIYKLEKVLTFHVKKEISLT